MYFILVSKGTIPLFDLHIPEQMNGRKHFEALDTIVMWLEPVTGWSEFREKM